MSLINSNLNQFIERLAEYNRLRLENRDDEETDEEHQALNSVLRFVPSLVDDIIQNINEIIHTRSAQIDNKLEEYISNKNLRTQIGKTLIQHPELKTLASPVMQNQIFSILDRIFDLPMSEDFQKLNSAEINPILTLLTRAILTKPLLEETFSEDYVNDNADDVFDNELGDNEDSYDEDFYNQETNSTDNFEDPIKEMDDSDEENYYDISSAIGGVQTDAIANLGDLGLTELQERLRDGRRNRNKVNDYLNSIKNYNPRSLNKGSLDLDLILDIFQEELKKDEQVDTEGNLEAAAEILSNFDLKPSSDFIENLVTKIQNFEVDRQCEALQALAGSEIDPGIESANLIARYMVKILVSSEENPKQLFSSKFLINNPQLSSNLIINTLAKALLISNPKQQEKSLCALIILSSWAKENNLKGLIKEALISTIQTQLSTEEINKNNDLSLLLLGLAPLLESPQELFDIYNQYQNSIDYETSLYFAAAILRFNQDLTPYSEKLTEDKGLLSHAINTVNKIINNENTETKRCSRSKLIRIKSLANIGIENLIKQDMEKEAFSFEIFWEAMQDPNAIELLNQYLQKTNLTNQQLEYLIKVITTRVVDVNAYSNYEGEIEAGELTTLLTKFANSSKEESKEILMTINKLLESHKKLFLKGSDKSTDETLEDSLILGFTDMGTKAEPYLLELVKQISPGSNDSIKSAQAHIADSALRRNRYLPEPSFAHSP